MLLKLHIRITVAITLILLLAGCAKEPVASFSAPSLVGVNQPVLFTNQSTDAKSYLWNFGDGGTSTNKDPYHTYTTSGIYTVTLTVSSANGTKKDVATRTITADMTQSFVGSYFVQQNCSGTSSVTYTMQTYINNGTLYLSGFDMIAGDIACNFIEGDSLSMQPQVFNNVTYSGTATITGDDFSMVYTKTDGAGNITNCTANCTKQ